MQRKGGEREYKSEQEFIDDTNEHFGTFKRIDSDEQYITMFIPHQDLDMKVYNPYTVSDDRHVVIISWKSEGDESVEGRLKEYANSLLGKQWRICKWPKAEGRVEIGDLKLKNTHHRCMLIWYM